MVFEVFKSQVKLHLNEGTIVFVCYKQPNNNVFFLLYDGSCLFDYFQFVEAVK